MGSKWLRAERKWGRWQLVAARSCESRRISRLGTRPEPAERNKPNKDGREEERNEVVTSATHSFLALKHQELDSLQRECFLLLTHPPSSLVIVIKHGARLTEAGTPSSVHPALIWPHHHVESWLPGGSNKVHKKKEKVQEANAADIALAAERVINDDESFISDSELMEVCCFEQLDTDLMEATATDSTATGMSAFNESVTHHLNELTLDAFQHEVATNILSTEFIDVFTRY
jgi:hypothetical protein